MRRAAPGAALVLAAVLAGTRSSPAGTEARVFRGAHEREISIRSFRRGVFFGSCGPATKSLLWEYSFTLRGDGPVYRPPAIEIRDGALQPVTVRAGSIALTERTIRIDLAIAGKERTVPFPYNGDYRIRP